MRGTVHPFVPLRAAGVEADREDEPMKVTLMAARNAT
jgi:hypothetical protein